MLQWLTVLIAAIFSSPIKFRILDNYGSVTSKENRRSDHRWASEKASCFDRRSVVILDGMRIDLTKEILSFSKWDFSVNCNGFFSRLSVDHKAEKEENSRWLKLAIRTRIQLYVKVYNFW